VHAAGSTVLRNDNQNCLLGLFTTTHALNMAHNPSDPGYYVQVLFTIFLIRPRFAQFEAADVYELFALHDWEFVGSRESIRVRHLCYLTSGRSVYRDNAANE
jgi:hypothetical protein